ncbi:hypothetical protein Btru_013640 [Bulinus truncatus]|nr:hypothetical protein Btru_013640 [Bulinus truncatus]
MKSEKTRFLSLLQEPSESESMSGIFEIREDQILVAVATAVGVESMSGIYEIREDQILVAVARAVGVREVTAPGLARCVKFHREITGGGKRKCS